MSALVPAAIAREAAGELELVTVTIDGQLFGIPVLGVRDVLRPQRIAKIPLAPAWVAGTLNLRGRIVTAIDMRVALGLAPMPHGGRAMSVVVDGQSDLYALLVDEVGEVARFPGTEIAPNPPTLDPQWRQVAAGVTRLDEHLLIVLDVARLLDARLLQAA
jgi:purine-binding chemotaxis protein CheW